MPRFYIEIEHETEPIACLRAVKVLQEAGSHFLTHACYGCEDGDHTARLMMDLDTKNEALMIVPPAYRQKAKIVQLCSFSAEDVERLLAFHSS
jgi:hypothetical protein